MRLSSDTLCNVTIFLCLLVVLSLLSLTFQSELTSSIEDDYDDDYHFDEALEKRNFVNKSLRSSRLSNMSLRFTSRDSPLIEPYVRLSSSLFKPFRYQVYWDLSEGIETFSGTVQVSFTVLSPTRSLAIQVNTLNITSLSLHYQDNNEEIIVSKSWLDKSDIYAIETQSNVTDNRLITMFMQFKGTFQTFGFLIHESTTPTPRYTYMTKFEPIHARKAFPCFDEPDMKAHFKISVKHNSSLTAYSNMPLESIKKFDGKADDNGNNWHISEFQESPLMTTYLVALVVCDCHRSVASTSQGVELGIITLKEDANKTDYALSITVKCMEFFQQYLGIGYKFPKLDIFAAPHYPSFGMEHSGLIIQFYHRILYQKDGQYEVYNKEWILYTTAHEIAHQWFGNLVTLRWWEHTWLNEGFATYFATKAITFVDPEMSSDDLFLINQYRTSLYYDLRGIYTPWNRTIAPITHSNQIKQSFSWLSYQKGGSILRMMEDFLGSDNMNKLMRSYLTKFADSNVETNDFSEEAGKYYSEINMTEFIDSWTKQSGCPIINVAWNNDGTIRLSQLSSLAHKSIRKASKNSDSHNSLINTTDPERSSPHIVSSSSPSSPSPSSSSSKFNKLINESSVTWLIPITYKTSDGFSGLIWLTKDHQDFKLCDNCSWVVFNVNKKGYYVINYSSSQWSTLIDALSSEPESFSSETFTGLLFDGYHLCELGLMEVSTFFGLLSNIKRYSSLASLSLALSTSKVPFGAPAFGEGRYLLNEFRRDLLESIYHKVSMTQKSLNEDYAKMILRYELLEDACEMKVPDCLKDASSYLQSWINDSSAYIPVYLQNVVFRYGMATLNNFTYWETILHNLLTGNLNGMKGTALIRGLFAIKEDNLREKAYSLLKDTEYEIEASVLIESKCPTISTRPNPLKTSVLKWLINENLYGFPWRHEKKSIQLSMDDQSEASLSPSHNSNSPFKPFHYSINLLFLPSPSLMVKGSLDLRFSLNETTKHCLFLVGPQLTVTSVSVHSINLLTNYSRKQLIFNSFHYRPNNLFVVQFQNFLELGNYSIHLTYTGNYSAAIVKGNQQQPNGGSSMSLETVELKGGPKLFPVFNHSLDSPTSFSINLVYRLTADEPLISSSSNHHHEGATIIHSASTLFDQILPSQLRITLAPESVRLVHLKESMFDVNETVFLQNLDNSI